MPDQKDELIRDATQTGDNAVKWAKAYCACFPQKTPDEDTVMGWFANAIENAWDRRVSAALKAKEAAE